MTLSQLELLSQSEQLDILAKAIKLAQRSDEEYKFELFEYEDFFIELRSSLLLEGRRIIEAVDSAEMFDPYLIEMHLSDFQE